MTSQDTFGKPWLDSGSRRLLIDFPSAEPGPVMSSPTPIVLPDEFNAVTYFIDHYNFMGLLSKE